MGRMPHLDLLPVLDHLNLVADPVAAALKEWLHAGDVRVAEIDPELADTAVMSEAYGTAMEQSVNCVIISGKRSGVERIAACLVRADTRADVNTVVKKLPDVRKCSFHPMDRAVEQTERSDERRVGKGGVGTRKL